MTDAERGEPWTREQVLQALEILGLRAPEVEPPRRTWSSGSRRSGVSGYRLMLAGCVLAAAFWLYVGAPWMALSAVLGAAAVWWVERACRDLGEPEPLSRPVPRPMPVSRLPVQPQPLRPSVTARGGRNRPMPVTFRLSPVPRRTQ